ncbi:MAG: glycoside hydrolase family 30 protein [Eubacteriales bacterium]|nr:glycoside hydrolase family 30 protein [Eubacteriales bacterium]
MNLRCYTTTCKHNIRKTQLEELAFSPDGGREDQLVNLYPQVRYQALEGFGGAVTESAGYVFSQMSPERQQELLRAYFGPDAMGYKMVRIPIDSCDFSLGHYEADSDEEDVNFEHFSFRRVEQYILPLLDAAQEAAGEKLDIMLTPWSPPRYMKTNGDRNHGGSLKPQYRKRWAEYICRYIAEYRRRGYSVTKLTIQNEPKAVQTWDSCIFTAAEEKAFLKDFLWPSLEAHGLTDIGIYLWDHNKERALEWADAILDEQTAPMVEGIAFHWYSGDHFETLGMIRERFPDKKLLLSEACIEYSKFDAGDYLRNAQKYAHDMIGNFCQGMNTFLDWNLVLDAQGGPNHVKNYCDAPYLFDAEQDRLIESNIRGYIWHFSHFLPAGAVRIGLSRYTDKLELAAFQVGEALVFIALNRTDGDIPAYIRLDEQCAKITVPANAIATGVIDEIPQRTHGE